MLTVRLIIIIMMMTMIMTKMRYLLNTQLITLPNSLIPSLTREKLVRLVHCVGT